MKPALLLLAPLFAIAIPSMAEEIPRYAVARMAAPVLNTPDFPGVFGSGAGKGPRTDRCGQIREVEFIALPGTPFRIEGKERQGESVIFRVATNDYPYPPKTGYYVDSRFVSVSAGPPPERPRRLPPRERIVESLLAAQGSPYVWGGNVRRGVPQFLDLYPPAGENGGESRRPLQGVDCSGLLYEATGGWTPRNTSALTGYGAGVPIAGLSPRQIAKRLEPLDLIVWNGHVIIVVDRERAIESRLECGTAGGGGVVVTPLRQRLQKIMQSRTPADAWDDAAQGGKIFVVRRWHSSAHSAQQDSLLMSLENPWAQSLSPSPIEG